MSPLNLEKSLNSKKKKMSTICSETLNTEWGPVDPKNNRRVKTLAQAIHTVKSIQISWLI